MVHWMHTGRIAWRSTAVDSGDVVGSEHVIFCKLLWLCPAGLQHVKLELHTN